MSDQKINEKEDDDSMNLPPPPTNAEQNKKNIGYNCSECSSLINKNLKDKTEKHNDQNDIYYLDHQYLLSERCLKLKIYKTQNEIFIEKEQLKEEDININIITDKIKYYNNKIQNIEENKMNEYKNEFNNNKIKENKRTRKIIKLNKIQKLKELKSNKDKYMNDIDDIKRKYENEI